jgi:hypothetical protein
MTSRDNIFTICTDTIDRYYSVMEDLNKQFGRVDKTEAAVRYNCIFKNAKLDYIEEGTYKNRLRWHNLKYYTWVEQQGKTVEELNALKHPDFWLEKQSQIESINEKLKQARGF